MQTYVVEPLSEKAVALLRDLESLAIIRLTLQEPQPTGRLSEQFRNTITPEVAADLHQQLNAMRNEWERDI